MTLRRKILLSAMAGCLIAFALWPRADSPVESRFDHAIQTAYARAETRDARGSHFRFDFGSLRNDVIAIAREEGPNAVPVLLRWIEDDVKIRSRPRRYARALAMRLSIKSQLFWRWAGYGTDTMRAKVAATALVALGPVAAPAIPRLRQIVRDHPAADRYARETLAGLGAPP